MKDFLEICQKRYTAKHYDGSKKIAKADLDKLLEMLRLTPSAVNVQPWMFFVGGSDKTKKEILPAIPDFNISRIDNCSNFVVLCIKTQLTDEDLDAITAKEDADGRYPSHPDIRDAVGHHRKEFFEMHVNQGDYLAWATHQTYIAMATLLYGAQSLGIDSTAMEGVNFKALDEIMGLKEKNLKSVAIVALGYGIKDDSNKLRPKSRLATDAVIKFLD